MIILAAVDLSSASVDAARTALTLARHLGDELLLVHAVEPLPGVTSAASATPGQPPDHHTYAANLDALKNLRTSLLADDVGVELRVVEGRPYDALMVCAEQCKPRLIVMGSHGRRAVARLLLGSVTQKIMLAAPCPVLVMRQGTAPFAAWHERPLRITAGIDRVGTATAITTWLQPLQAAGPTEITLLHEFWPAREQTRLALPNRMETTQKPESPTEGLPRADTDIAQILEHQLRDELLAQGIGEEYRLRVCPVQGPVSEQLGIDASADAADLLIVATPHVATNAHHSVWGSTAAATMSATRVPLLVLPVG
jgi:nucleotide-binding universal stress UspA family protein